MTKFDRNQRVVITHEGKLVRGKVTGVGPKKRRVVTDSGKRLLVSVYNLRDAKEKILILETRLDRNLKSNRIYGPMMKQWFSA